MTAQYISTPNGRHFVNQDFVDDVKELYPVTCKRIPLGWHVYTSPQGKDEVWFTTHAPLPGMQGMTYEVTFHPERQEAFFGGVLSQVQYIKVAHEESDMTRQRLTWEQDRLATQWGNTMEEVISKQARAPSGLYGYTKAIQASCETVTRKLNRQATSMITRAVQKDPRVLDFLGTHAKRAKSQTAKILLAAYKESMPKLAATDKEANRYGIYGFPVKTAALGLSSCTQLREMAGVLAADLHRRQAALYPKIVGFLGEHSRTAKCGSSKLILSVYPDEGCTFGSMKQASPQTVEDWLMWEPEAS